MANHFVVIPELKPEVGGFEVQDYIYNRENEVNKTKNLYMGFHIPKIGQILKHFANFLLNFFTRCK